MSTELIVASFAFIAALVPWAVLWQRQRPSSIIVVEEYQVEVVTTEGFKKLHLRFQDGSRNTYRFEMHPAYAHHFSDAILTKAAQAMKPELAG